MKIKKYKCDECGAEIESDEQNRNDMFAVGWVEVLGLRWPRDEHGVFCSWKCVRGFAEKWYHLGRG